MNNIYNLYNVEIEKIKRDSTTQCIFLVGSSKDLNLDDEGIKVNDIDLFVLCDQIEYQVRENKEIQGLEFDISYFSKDGMNKFIASKEYFFLNEMKNAKVVYDKTEVANGIIYTCKEKYKKGPNKLSNEEKKTIKDDIYSKVSRLKDREKFNKFEYEFLTNLYLRDIIVAYFSINDKWIPKDKKLVKQLEVEDKDIFNLLLDVNKSYNYEDLLVACDYIFKNITY